MAQWLNVDFFKNALDVFKPSLFMPHYHIKDINLIPFDEFSRNGIEGIIFDADQTLTVYHGTEIHPAISSIFEVIKETYGPDKLAILSNYAGNQLDDKRSQRKDAIERNLGIKVLSGKRKKPAVEAYLDAMKYLGTMPETTAMVGDRLPTDIMGANKAGLKLTVLVDGFDLHNDPWYVKSARAAERDLYDFYQDLRLGR